MVSTDEFIKAKQALGELLIYRPLHRRPLFLELEQLFENPNANYHRFFSHLAETAVEQPPILECLWQNFFLQEVLCAKNLFTYSAEAGNVTGTLAEAAAYDLRRLEFLFKLDFSSLAPQLPPLQGLRAPKAATTPFEKLVVTIAQTENWSSALPILQRFYHRYGAGELCRFSTFRWSGALVGISHPDPITVDGLVGLKQQKEILIANTKQFLRNLPANCALLYGARGTGKSSLVKAVSNLFAADGLHLIEVAKEDLEALPEILSLLSSRAAKFILFIDDLSFEEEEISYKALKASLEGSVADRPANILIYATSNRRHLVVESFRERDEIHGADTIEEKLSLSDRFGLKINFLTPDQREYLDIVEKLAGGLPISQQELCSRALAWERHSSGRSGRVARQFVTALAGELKSG